LKPKVDFFIVGAAKAGTTSLYSYLNKHPEIEMSTIKEPDYFSNEFIEKQSLYYKKESIKSLNKYHSLYSDTKNLIRGEASVSYLFYEKVPKKIFKYNSRSKVIIMLRNPSDRAYSHYLMDKRLGFVRESFENIVHKKSTHKNSALFYQQYIELGQYSFQIKNYFDVFSKKNILIIDYDDFIYNSSEVLNKVCVFLNVENRSFSNTNKVYNKYTNPSNKLVKILYTFRFLREFIGNFFSESLKIKIQALFFTDEKKPTLNSEIQIFLKEYYKVELERLSKLLNQNYSKWIK
jgi:hypothetical protein